MTDLKPCPFCGSDDLFPARVSNRYIECNSCGCVGPFVTNKRLDGSFFQWEIVEAAINDAWNSRATPEAAAATVDGSMTDTALPDYPEEAPSAAAYRGMTALEKFVYDWQAGSRPDEWRRDLTAVLKEALAPPTAAPADDVRVALESWPVRALLTWKAARADTAARIAELEAKARRAS